MRVGGFEPFSTLDFPGRLAAVVFCQGCPLACGYCHNPDLIPATAERLIDFDSVLARLEARRDFLEAVVFSGGEPLAQAALAPAIEAVKARGFAVALHTAVTAPALLDRVLAHVDWVGFDVKAPFDRYDPVTGVAKAGPKARASLERLAASGVPFEARTTVWPVALDADDIRAIAFALQQLGVRRYVLQETRTADRRPWPGGSAIDDAALLDEVGAMFDEFEVRRAES
ncbi:anaerobic ribonucleoside-triphosphate reductase activating protein [Marinicauda salina]|uniref:anaerobic ribonucleoside-triphosphate reductase activating protein n=1 Tax=Marinicauda salina TaxID=2135793 RepID=UPI001E33DCB3|nr:anaerobic ribonucleoside-triphosphate reductase activating protein [Marinicauda salina]